jgi:hypothetical protein
MQSSGNRRKPFFPIRCKFLSSRLSIDLRALALFRIAIGILFAQSCALRSVNTSEHYSHSGILPSSLRVAELNEHSNIGSWSLFLIHDSMLWCSFLLVLGAISGIALALGWKTRFWTLMCLALAISLRARLPQAEDGGDVLLQLFMFWGLFLPLGRVWSVDSRGNPVALNSRTPIFSMATIAILIQMLLVYIGAAVAKTDPVWRVQGTALAEALQIESLTTSFGALCSHLPSPVLAALTHVVLIIEEVGPLLAILIPLSSPWRAAGPLLMFSLHAGIAATFALGQFPWIAISGWLLFLPSCIYDALEYRLTQQPRATSVSLPSTSQGLFWVPLVCLCLGMASFISNLPFLSQAHLLPTWAIWLANASGLRQNWSMFSPGIRTQDGWFVAVATFEDGTQRDIWQHLSPPSFQKPPSVRLSYRNERWREYLSDLFHSRRAKRSTAFANWLQQDWNSQHPHEPVTKLEVYFLLQDSRKPQEGVTPILLYPIEGTGPDGKAYFRGDPRTADTSVSSYGLPVLEQAASMTTLRPISPTP